MDRRRTFILRECVSCRSPFGFGVWPWSGETLAKTHGLCRSCVRHLEAAFDDPPVLGPPERDTA